MEFGLVCLIPIVLLGFFLLSTLKSNVETRAIANAREQARLVADVGVAGQLAGVDDISRGISGGAQIALDHNLKTIRSASGVSRVVVRNRNGRTVYADDHSLIGKSAAPSGAAAALDGTIVSGVTFAGDAGQVLAVFVPLKVKGAAPIGWVDTGLPYGRVQGSIARQTHRIQLMLFLGLLVLWGTLLTVVHYASQRLRRQAAEKEELALSDSLPGLANRTMFQEAIGAAISGSGRRKVAGAVMLM